MIPLYLVTGFLGAGKTSLLNRLLSLPALQDTLVVVNEFGEAALDHRLYDKLDGEARLMASGCLCCTLRGDFVDGLIDILARREAQRFARVIVETSGLADPGPVLHALFADPQLAARVRLAGITTVVDALNGLATLERQGEARRQVALADRIAVSKTDLADPAPTLSQNMALLPLREKVAEGRMRGPALRARLADLAPLADVTEAPNLTAAAFLAETLHPPKTFSPRAVHGAARAHVFRSAAPLPPAAFRKFLGLLGEFAGPKLLRVKGLVATADAPDRPWLVQAAQHAFAEPDRLPAWPPGAKETALVVIGEDLGEAPQRLWDALTGAIRPDTPDWAAFADNPLAPRSGGLLG